MYYDIIKVYIKFYTYTLYASILHYICKASLFLDCEVKIK